MQLPGMLVAKLFRSTVPHGRIRSIDTSAAKKVPGVLHVVTIDDVKQVIPHPYYGPAFHDQPILADQKVRFVGEPVAAVIAVNPHVAEEAVQLITAEYDELPAVFDEVEALTSQTYVHDELRPAVIFADLKHLKGIKDTNVALTYKLRRGDFETAYAAAAHKFEHEFRTQKTLHLSLEPHATIADFKDTGVTLYTASQGPSFVRTEIARLLGWPENRVRIKVPYLGAGYGSKLYIKLEALALALSMIARRPVKVALTMEEMFYQITKHPCTFRIKTGVDNDGRIVARKCEVFWNGGAYADIGPRVTQKAGLTASGPYDIDNVSIDSHALYTNLTPSGALRGFGVPQLVWAYESQTDMMAHALKLDPIEFRRKNLMRDGRQHTTGQLLKDAAIEKVMDACSRPHEMVTTIRQGHRHHSPWSWVCHRDQDRDHTDHVGRDREHFRRRFHHALLQHHRYGPGFEHRHGADRRRGAQHSGRNGADRAVRHRCHAIRHGHAGLALDVSHGSCRASGRARMHWRSSRHLARDVGEPEGSNIPVPELFKKRYGMQAGNVIGSGVYKPDYVSPDPETGLSPNVTPFWMMSGVGAEVEVDTETGHVRIAKLINVIDCGKAINPKTRRDTDLRCRADASRFHDVRKDASRRRSGHQRLSGGLQDSRHPRPAWNHWRISRSRTSSTMDLSAPKASAKSRPSAYRRRSPMRSTTRSASV